MARNPRPCECGHPQSEHSRIGGCWPRRASHLALCPCLAYRPVQMLSDIRRQGLL